jgi:hypothetical protein
MDTKRMCRTAEAIGKKTRKPAIVIFADMVYCGFRYRAGYSDYSLFEFYDRTKAQRETYLTRGKSNDLIRACNQKDRAALVENKLSFCKLYADFLGRDVLDITQAAPREIDAFRAKHPVFFAKTPDGMCGSGVRKVSCADAGQLAQDGFLLWEEPIVQHPRMNALNPSCINTLRVMTLLADGDVHVLGVFLRIGNKSNVDNLNAGGMAAKVDAETGIVVYPAADKNGTAHTAHPTTGAAIVGFQIPLWQECLAMIRRAALVEPSVRYLGWDVAVTPTAPVLVEANALPGHDICQLPAHTPAKTGLIPILRELLPKEIFA